MNICFIANYNKTYFFYEIAKKISEKYNINVFWIIVNEKNYNFLKIKTNNILYLTKGKVLHSNNLPIDEFRLNELILGDRVLKFNQLKGEEYLTKIQQPVYNFIKENKIQYIFGELTWAHEILIYRITKYCKELKCTFLNPHTIRIPEGRFAFFEDEFQSKIYTNHQSEEVGFDLEEKFTPKKPEYLLLNDKILKKKNSLKGRLKRFKNLITSENLDKEDITLPEKWTFNKIWGPVYEEINKETYKLVRRINIDFIKDKNFILLTLHKQPEASIDVLGRYTEDQFTNIINIWKQLPQNWWLVIKEHTNAIGDRPLSFYKKLQKYKNLVFINEKTDSYQLLEYCQAVVTVSGTIAYEAALLKKKALVFADVFFNFSYVKKITFEELKTTKNLLEILKTIPSNKEDKEKIKFIYQNSFEGIISDPVSNPKCIESINIDKIADAISKLK